MFEDVTMVVQYCVFMGPLSPSVAPATGCVLLRVLKSRNAAQRRTMNSNFRAEKEERISLQRLTSPPRYLGKQTDSAYTQYIPI